MAIKTGKKTVTIEETERTWRTEIESPFGGEPTITAHREVMQVAEDGSVISRETGITVRRTLAELVESNDKVTVGKNVYTAAEIAAAIPAFIDQWREADLERLAEEAERAKAAQDEAGETE